jgi:hypothetical protein
LDLIQAATVILVSLRMANCIEEDEEAEPGAGKSSTEHTNTIFWGFGGLGVVWVIFGKLL